MPAGGRGHALPEPLFDRLGVGGSVARAAIAASSERLG